MKITHGACGKTWTGANRSHCPVCCETFNSETAADKHRKGTFGVDRHCVPPTDAGLIAVEHPWGPCWQTPGSDDRWPTRTHIPAPPADAAPEGSPSFARPRGGTTPSGGQ